MMNIWITILAIIGFAVSAYIHGKKYQGEKLICIVGKDCDLVVNSKYNSLFGIPNEIIGILYYGGITIFSAVDIIPLPLMIMATGGAAFYSLVLIFIQAFILKEWCEYCLVSAGVSIIIFVFKITPLLALY